MKNPFEEYPEIKFADVRKGDTVARVETDTDILDVTIGVAAEHANDTWYTAGGGYALIYVYNMPNADDKFYLIDRPKRELPTEAGRVIRVTKYAGSLVEPPVLAMRCHTKYTPSSDDPENFMACLPIGNTASSWLVDSWIEDFEILDLTPAQ